jgi:NAD(P)H-hydrate epimerase
MKTLPLSALPHLTTAQMVEVDRLMIKDWGISLVMMMENAGRNLASLARNMLGGVVRGKDVIALCGTGNNGGGGMAAARHLHNWGANVRVILTGAPEKLKPVPAQQRQPLQKMSLFVDDVDLEAADLLIDAMIGYGLQGAPRQPIAGWIAKANASGTPILALDAPTGLDTTTVVPSELCIRARATLTLAMPKVGLVQPEARSCVGELFLADIGVPPELYAAPSLGLAVQSPFEEGMIVRLSY